MDTNEFNKVEKIKLLKPTRVRIKGEDTAKLYNTGDVVEVSGNDKVQLLGTGAGKRLKVEEKKK